MVGEEGKKGKKGEGHTKVERGRAANGASRVRLNT